MLYGVAIATVPDPGGPTEHKGKKHLFAIDTLSVEDDSEKCTRGVHMCGCQKGSFEFPHLGQMRSTRIESPSLASDPSASHGAPWSLSTWHISGKLPPQAFHLWSSSEPTISLPIVRGSRVWGWALPHCW